MTFRTAAGTQFFIGTTMAAATSTEFAADTYQEVKEVESYGEFGDSAQGVDFEAVGDARTRTAKGSRNAGTLALVCGRDPFDPGQVAMSAAQKTSFNYNFKMVLPDKGTGTGATNTIIYLRGLVMGEPNNVGSNNNVIRRTFPIKLNAAPVEVPATLGTGGSPG